MSYEQLTYEQRCQIYVLNKSDMTQQDIADAIGVTQPTISRELRRNIGERGYRHKQAQKMSDDRRMPAVKAIKMTPEVIKLIESKLRLKWSPEQILGWLLEERGELHSYETIYVHIWADKVSGGNLFNYLRRKGKAYNPRSKDQA